MKVRLILCPVVRDAVFGELLPSPHCRHCRRRRFCVEGEIFHPSDPSPVSRPGVSDFWSFSFCVLSLLVLKILWRTHCGVNRSAVDSRSIAAVASMASALIPGSFGPGSVDVFVHTSARILVRLLIAKRHRLLCFWHCLFCSRCLFDRWLFHQSHRINKVDARLGWVDQPVL